MEKQLEYIKYLEWMIEKCKEDVELFGMDCAFEFALKKFKEINDIE